MKKLYWVLVLATVVTACQQQAPVTQNASKRPLVQTIVHKTNAASVGQLDQPTALTPAMRHLLQRNDLAPLLQTVHPAGDSTMQNHAQNGFFGPTHHRIEVVITGARRDLRQSERYYLAGKTRYKGIVTPFERMLTIRQLLDQTLWSKRELAYDHSSHDYNHDARYTALGDFVLREDSTRKNSGIF